MQVRPADLANDTEQLLAIDTSYETDAELLVVRRPDLSIALVRHSLEVPVRRGAQQLAADLRSAPQDQPWSNAMVAVAPSGELVGFIASGFEAWNRRLRIWHLYVCPNHRRQGIARELLTNTIARHRGNEASHLFLETSSSNAPAIAAYLRLGLNIVGFDASLYRSTGADGEVAVYLARDLFSP